MKRVKSKVAVRHRAVETAHDAWLASSVVNTDDFCILRK
jgi:hypothetical protein